MGVGKDMKNFIASMTEQTGFGGYGAKIKSTPMGPFRWNDMIQLWENVNNGMVMNNISFQDMFMMDYDTIGGGEVVDTSESVYEWGFIDWASGVNNVTNFSSDTGGQASSALANIITFKNLPQVLSIGLTASYNLTGATSDKLYKFVVNKSGTVLNIPPTTGFTVGNGDTLRIAATTPFTAGWTNGNSGFIYVQDLTRGITLDGIPFAFTYSEPEPP